MRKSLLFVAIAAFSVSEAFALNSRSAVSVNGLDTNPCTVASPCRSFGSALAQTASGGEVIALDSAGYGPFIVFDSFTVSGAPGVHAAITAPAAAGYGIQINAAATTRVTLRNLVLIGAGATTGILDVQSAEVRILNCLVRGFANQGIDIYAGRVAIASSTILDQINAVGIIADSNGSDVVQLTIDNSLIEGNDTGIYVQGHSGVMVTSSTVSGSTFGVYVTSTVGTGISPRATLESCTLAFNAHAVTAAASGGNNTAKVYLAQDEISYNTIDGVLLFGSGQVYTFNNNRFTENAADGGALTPIAFK